MEWFWLSLTVVLGSDTEQSVLALFSKLLFPLHKSFVAHTIYLDTIEIKFNLGCLGFHTYLYLIFSRHPQLQDKCNPLANQSQSHAQSPLNTGLPSFAECKKMQRKTLATLLLQVTKEQPVPESTPEEYTPGNAPKTHPPFFCIPPSQGNLSACTCSHILLVIR